MVILFVGLKMLSELQYSLSQQGNLYFWRTRIRIVDSELIDDFAFYFCTKRHGCSYRFVGLNSLSRIGAVCKVAVPASRRTGSIF